MSSSGLNGDAQGSSPPSYRPRDFPEIEAAQVRLERLAAASLAHQNRQRFLNLRVEALLELLQRAVSAPWPWQRWRARRALRALKGRGDGR